VNFYSKNLTIIGQFIESNPWFKETIDRYQEVKNYDPSKFKQKALFEETKSIMTEYQSLLQELKSHDLSFKPIFDSDKKESQLKQFEAK